MPNPLVSEVITSMRQRIHDTGSIEYQDAELISYINDAIDALSLYLISNNNAEMIANLDVTDNMPVPDNYKRLNGGYPIHIENGAFRTSQSDIPTVSVRYYAVRDHVSDPTDTMPFNRSYLGVISQIAVIYALNRNEYDVGSEEALLNQVLGLLSKSIGGGGG